MTYPVTYTRDSTDESRMILTNFAFIDEQPPYGIVDGKSVMIPTQQVCYDQSVTVQGTGQYISKNESHWEYTETIGGDLHT